MNFLGGNKKKYTVLNSIITLLSDRQAFFNFVFVLLQKNSDIEGTTKKFCYVIKAILYYN